MTRALLTTLSLQTLDNGNILLNAVKELSNKNVLVKNKLNHFLKEGLITSSYELTSKGKSKIPLILKKDRGIDYMVRNFSMFIVVLDRIEKQLSYLASSETFKVQENSPIIVLLKKLYKTIKIFIDNNEFKTKKTSTEFY